VQYEAPAGYHDDCIIALALAAWQLKHNLPSSGAGIVFPKQNPRERDFRPDYYFF
jgi:hypothetical protein